MGSSAWASGMHYGLKKGSKAAMKRGGVIGLAAGVALGAAAVGVGVFVSKKNKK